MPTPEGPSDGLAMFWRAKLTLDAVDPATLDATRR
jgi:hypothetical protein